MPQITVSGPRILKLADKLPSSDRCCLTWILDVRHGRVVKSVRSSHRFVYMLGRDACM